MSPVQDLAQRINGAYERRQSLETDPMFDYDGQDLLSYAETAGFGERHLELRVDVTRQAPRPWDVFVRVAPNPRAPTLAEAMAETLAVAEIERFVAHLRPLVEHGAGSFSVAVTYLWAVKD